MAQGVGLEFKAQYLREKKKKRRGKAGFLIKLQPRMKTQPGNIELISFSYTPEEL
jgi:hypothetical protein